MPAYIARHSESAIFDLTREVLMQLALSLSSLASAYGAIDAKEVKLLEHIYRSLEIDAHILYSHLHGRNFRPASVSASVGNADREHTPSFTVDTKRLDELHREAEQVGELLAGVFMEEESAHEVKYAEGFPDVSAHLLPKEIDAATKLRLDAVSFT